MANTTVNPTWVLNESGQRFVNSVKGVAAFNRSLDESFSQAGAKVGDTVQYRLPQQFVAQRGSAYSAQDIYDRTVPIRLSYQSHVDFDYSVIEATLELDRIRERYINPAADVLASDADQQGMKDVYPSVYHNVGTPGTVPNSNLVYLEAGVKMTDMSTPLDRRVATLYPLAMATIANANQTLFHPSGPVSSSYRTGQFAEERLGISSWYQDQNTPSHTTGTFTSCTPTVNGANQTGASILTQAWASGATTLKKGDWFTLAGVYSVNPLSKVNTGSLQQFVVTADATDTVGAITISISPSIVTSGALQNVSGSPANGAGINYLGQTGTYAQASTTYRVSLIHHPDAFAFVMADLAKPEGGVDFNRIRSRDFGISLSFVRAFDVDTYKNKSRIDALFGAAPLQPRMASRA